MNSETDDTHESDILIYHIFKYLTFLPGFVALFQAYQMYAFPQEFVAEDGALPDMVTIIVIALVGVLFILIAVLVFQKIVKVEMDYQIIKIKKDGKEIEVKWSDVESVSMIPTVTPPLYKLRLKNYEDYFLFNTEGKGFRFFGLIWDWSDMGKLIRDKKDRFGIWQINSLAENPPPHP